MKLSFKILSLCFVACLLVFCTNAKVTTEIPYVLKQWNVKALEKYSVFAGHESHSHNNVLIVCLGSTSSVSTGGGFNFFGLGGSGDTTTTNPIPNCYFVVGGHTHDINKNDGETFRIERACAKQDLVMYADADITDSRNYELDYYIDYSAVRNGDHIVWIWMLTGSLDVEVDNLNSECRDPD